MEPGKFIVVEGIDGAGKSTHLEFICQAIERHRGAKALLTREPGGTPLAERIRELLLHEPMDSDTEVLLAVAARRDHVVNVIKPALESGQWVVCDRFTESTRAYQGGGGGVDMAWIDRLNQQATLGLKPDRTYLFDAPAELAAQRRSQRGRASDRFESQDAEFFDRVRDVYLNRPQVDSLKRLVIDSSETVTNIQKLLEKDISSL